MKNEHATGSRWIVSIDTRDVIGISGAALIVVGGWLIHPGVAVAVAGAEMLAFAWRLSR